MPGRYGVAVSKASGLYFSPEKTFASGEYSIVPCCQRKQFYAHSCCEFDGSTASSDARKSGTPQCLSGARSVTWALRSSRQSRPRQGDSGVAGAQAGQEHKTQEVQATRTCITQNRYKHLPRNWAASSMKWTPFNEA